MENDFHYLLWLFSDGLTVRTEKFGVSGLLAHAENRDKSKRIDFFAKDEKDAQRIAKEWMLGQMLINYKDLREITLFLANRIRTVNEIDNG